MGCLYPAIVPASLYATILSETALLNFYLDPDFWDGDWQNEMLSGDFGRDGGHGGHASPETEAQIVAIPKAHQRSMTTHGRKAE